MALAAPHLPFPTSMDQDDDKFVAVDPAGDSTSAFTFITQTGRPSKSSVAQRLVRKHVMREIGKSRRKGRPAKSSILKVSLDVPDSPSWQEPLSQQAYVPGVEELVPELDENPQQDPVDIAPELTNSISYSRPLDSGNENLNVAVPAEVEESQTSIVRLGGGRSDPFAQYPIRMDLRAHELIDHIFDVDNANFRPFRESWFPVGMMDPASFHQILANSALSLSILKSTGNAPESYESMAHHAHAIKLVNKRMSDPSFRTSDALVGAVMAFVCYYNITGNAKNWRLHMDGLIEIVRLRGGPEKADFNPYVRVVLSWVDIGGAQTQDLPPAFPIPSSFSSSPTFPTSISIPLLSAQISLHWRTVHPSSPKIITILDDLAAFTTYLKAQAALTDNNIYSETRLAANYVNPLLHRLLSLSGTSAVSPVAIDTADEEAAVETEAEAEESVTIMTEALRLAAILYLAPLRRRFGVIPVISARQLSKLRLLLRNPAEEIPDYWSAFPLLHVWVLAMGIVETQEVEDVDWFVRRLVNVRRGGGGGDSGSAGIGSAGEGGVGEGADVLAVLEDVVGLLRGFLWVDDVHGVAFWRKARWCSWE